MHGSLLLMEKFELKKILSFVEDTEKSTMCFEC